MARKYYSLAVVALLLIPVTWVLGGTLAIAINPEIALGHPHYGRNFWLLNELKQLLLIGSDLLVCVLWLVCCGFLLKAKARSYRWLPLAVFGPFGLTVLAMLGDRSPGAGDVYRRFLGRMKLPLRVVYEAVLFVGIWTVAYQVMVFLRELLIWRQSVVTRVPIDVIVEQQNASGGMYAFSEGNEVLFLVALFYLMWPVCVNLAGWLGTALVASRRG